MTASATPDLDLARYLMTREMIRAVTATLKALQLDQATMASEMMVQALVLACPAFGEDAAREQVNVFWNTMAANLKAVTDAQRAANAGVIQFSKPANDAAPLGAPSCSQ